MLARPVTHAVRINVGCGATPTPGWVNLDNSPTVWLAAFPWLWPFLSSHRRRFARTARVGRVRHGVATRLRFRSASADALYSSHMMEHLDQAEARQFLAEARRVLKPGGVLRLALPDVRRQAEAYLVHGDADRFISGTLMAYPSPRGPIGRLRAGVLKPRHHLWMYDGPSLLKLLTEAGFANSGIVPSGRTTIPDPGMLDLFERESESVYVEARRP